MSLGAAPAEIAPPSWSGAAHARNLVGLALRAAYRIRVHGLHRVPLDGPLLLVANHTGPLDGPVLLGTAPRPVHVVDDVSAWPPVVARAARAGGAIPTGRDPLGRDALAAAVAALADPDRAVAVFPEGVPGPGDARQVRPGVGYLVARTGVAVLPVAVLGGRGRNPVDPPRPRSVVEVVYGDPVVIPVAGDPRRRRVCGVAAEAVRQLLADHVAAAVARTGREPDGAVVGRPPRMPEDGRGPATAAGPDRREVLA